MRFDDGENRCGTQATSRRRDVRLEPPPQLTVFVPSFRGRLAVQDISASGVCVVTDAPVPLRSVHTVTLKLGSRGMTRQARIAHCRLHAGRWRLGMQFLAASPRETWTIEDLINALLESAISFS